MIILEKEFVSHKSLLMNTAIKIVCHSLFNPPLHTAFFRITFVFTLYLLKLCVALQENDVFGV